MSKVMETTPSDVLVSHAVVVVATTSELSRALTTVPPTVILRIEGETPLTISRHWFAGTLPQVNVNKSLEPVPLAGVMVIEEPYELVAVAASPSRRFEGTIWLRTATAVVTDPYKLLTP